MGSNDSKPEQTNTSQTPTASSARPPDKTPWLQNWKVEREIGHGGQGTTFLVLRNSDSKEAVLKLLLKDKETDAEARARMLREVTALKTLAAKPGCKVPLVFETNAEQFEDLNAMLYVIMDYIKGESLDRVITENKHLTLDESAALVLDLCSTMEKALPDVQHRDLKPENIIIRSLSPADAVIVDYGLSFNSQMSDPLTGSTEMIGNKFFRLPERTVLGGNCRDFRSDLTLLCGIFYYCLVGHAPVVLSDAKKLAPHRRPGFSVREKHGSDPRISPVEAFFDCGFAQDIDERFQTIANLRSRLELVLSQSQKKQIPEPAALASSLGERLKRQHRQTQLADYRANSSKVVQHFNQEAGKYVGKVPPCQLTVLAGPGVNRNLPAVFDVAAPDTQRLTTLPGIQVAVPNANAKRWLQYEIRVQAAQCGIYRALFKMVQKPIPNNPHAHTQMWEQIGTPECILWYDALLSPDCEGLDSDIKESIGKAIEGIDKEILG